MVKLVEIAMVPTGEQHHDIFIADGSVVGSPPIPKNICHLDAKM